MTLIQVRTLTTPVGPLTLLADGDVLAAGGFGADAPDLQARLDRRRRAGRLSRGDLGTISRSVQAYFDGDVDALDGIAVEQVGSDHQRRVWMALRSVPAGRTVAYAELAGRAGSPKAIRAAGSACGRNLIAPVVPCHRAVRSDGSLGGYFYGLDTKRRLLDHERRWRP